MTRPRRLLAAVAAAAVAMSLVACATDEPSPGPTRTDAAPPNPTDPPPPPPEPVLDGTAEQNLEFFDYTNGELINSGAALSGGAFVENLASQGYPRESLEVTPDTTAIGLAADNVVFSVKFADACLLGQWGNIGYTSLVTAIPANGRCIIGTDRRL